MGSQNVIPRDLVESFPCRSAPTQPVELGNLTDGPALTAGLRWTVGGASQMVTWEMADGTEIRYEGVGVEPTALREFVLRFMSSQADSWNAMHWSDDRLADAFERRFGHKVDVRRERRADGSTQFVIRPRLAFA